LHNIQLCYIQQGKPAQNGYIERFNNSITEVRNITKNWLEDYNHNRPHESLAHTAPIEFARCHGGTPMAVSIGTLASTKVINQLYL